jgi:hypothetical protein
MREGWEAFAAVTLERLPVLNNPQERRFLGALTKTSLNMEPDYHQLEFDARLWMTDQAMRGNAA